MQWISYQYQGRNSWGAVHDDKVLDLAEVTGIATLAEFVGSPAFINRSNFLSDAPVAKFEEVSLLPVVPAVVIGKGGRDIPVKSAYEHVAGYSCYNDASVREWQFHAKQIAAGKNFESTGGFGPWMVTADEIDPQRSLRLQTRVNGTVVHSSETKSMIFSIPTLINYIATIVTLSPGNVIATGTPAGVGFSHPPPTYMKVGDVCKIEIEGIGTLRNPIAAQA